MTLGYCENGVARVRLPFRAEFEEKYGVIHGGLTGLLADTSGNFAVGSVSPGSTVKTVEFKMNLLAGRAAASNADGGDRFSAPCLPGRGWVDQFEVRSAHLRDS